MNPPPPDSTSRRPPLPPAFVELQASASLFYLFISNPASPPLPSSLPPSRLPPFLFAFLELCPFHSASSDFSAEHDRVSGPSRLQRRRFTSRSFLRCPSSWSLLFKQKKPQQNKNFSLLHSCIRPLQPICLSPSCLPPPAPPRARYSFSEAFK